MAEELEIEISEVKDASELQRHTAGSKYEPVVEMTRELKPGQSFEVHPPIDVETDEDFANFRNRLSSAVRNAINGEFRIKMFRTTDDTIAIIRRQDAANKKRPKASSQASQKRKTKPKSKKRPTKRSKASKKTKKKTKTKPKKAKKVKGKTTKAAKKEPNERPAARKTSEPDK